MKVSEPNLKEYKFTKQDLLEISALFSHIKSKLDAKRKVSGKEVVVDYSGIQIAPRNNGQRVLHWLQELELTIGYEIKEKEKKIVVYRDMETDGVYKDIKKIIRGAKEDLNEIDTQEMLSDYKKSAGPYKLKTNLVFDDISNDIRYLVYEEIGQIYEGLKLKQGSFTQTYIMLKRIVENGEISYKHIEEIKVRLGGTKGKEVLVGSKGVGKEIGKKLGLPSSLRIFIDDKSNKKIILNEQVIFSILKKGG